MMAHSFPRFWSAGLAMIVVLASVAASRAADIPSSRKTQLGLYMTAVEASRAVAADPSRVLFLDVRTPGELMFVGAPSEIDANVPFVDLASPLQWDGQNNRPLFVRNEAFVSTVERRLKEKSLGKSDQVIVMCRSGDRSAKAVDVLASAGFTNVWTVIDGFEGDPSKDGRRDVNGWRNSGLPWTYTLDKSKLDLARDARE
jgi:rhodanese-related sulfurtransferase